MRGQGCRRSRSRDPTGGDWPKVFAAFRSGGFWLPDQEPEVRKLGCVDGRRFAAQPRTRLDAGTYLFAHLAAHRYFGRRIHFTPRNCCTPPFVAQAAASGALHRTFSSSPTFSIPPCNTTKHHQPAIAGRTFGVAWSPLFSAATFAISKLPSPQAPTNLPTAGGHHRGSIFYRATGTLGCHLGFRCLAGL